MPLTPDRRPGPSLEEELQLEADPVDPSIQGAVRYNGSAFRLRDAIGVFDPRSGGGLSAADHRTLLQLIHFIDEGPAEGFTTGATKTVTGSVFPTQVLWRRADATKLVEQNITWTGVLATTVEWKMYDTDGTTVLATVTDSVSYSGPFETGRTRSIA
jgi:hypothetical protein